MGVWLMKESNAYWNAPCGQWTSREIATEFSDSEVEEIELTGDAYWVFAATEKEDG